MKRKEMDSSTVKTDKPSAAKKPSSNPKTDTPDSAKTGLVQLKIELRDTEEEARLLKSLIRGKDEAMSPSRPTTSRIYLVTSAWHMLRAKMLFDHAGFDVIPAPTDFEMSCAAEKSFEFGDFVPSADALLRNSAAVKEWVARRPFIRSGLFFPAQLT